MRVLLLLVVLCNPNLCFAAPTVIYDSGNTQSLMGYLVSINPANSPRNTVPTKGMPQIYPVVTPELSPNTVTPRASNYPHLQHPLFIIGYDALSFRWLKTFHNTLLKHQAVGLVVNVDTAQQFEAIQAAAPGLEMYPGSGSQLAKEIDLHHYPALISTTRIEQ
jgi:integrating conjugative element protein (TIGR03765 family)